MSTGRRADGATVPCWLSAAVLSGMAVVGLGCSSSISTSTGGVDSGNTGAMTDARATSAQQAEAGGTSACNDCAAAAEMTGGACGSQVTTCASDSACKALVLCVNGCAPADTTCLGNCATTAGTVAVNEYQALSDCICGSACGTPCAAECGTSPNGTTPVDSGTTATPVGDRCAPAGCPTLTTMPVDFNSYCPNAPGTTRVCDCPGAGPPAPCTTATQGANLYCCP